MREKFKRLPIKLKRYRRVRLEKRVRKARLLSRHPFAVPIITIGVLGALTAGAYFLARDTHHLPPVQDAKIVIISHDHVQQVVPTKQKTVGALLAKLHITLKQGDVVEPSKSTHINQDDFRINIYRAVPVEIVDGSQKTFTFSAATTGRAIAEQDGVKLYPEDWASIEPTQNFLKDRAIGEQIVIDRATPVSVDLYGAQVTLRTHAKTVGALIKEKHIKPQKKDRITPALNTPITAGMQIGFYRTGSKVETKTEAIPMPIKTINDNSLAYGTSAIRQHGSPGQQLVTYKETLQNNVVTSKTILQKIVIKPAVTQIMVVGTSLSGIKGDMALAGIAPGDYQYADYIISHESGWCPTKAQGEHYCPAIPDNPYTSGGYGLCQATPGYKMETAGSDWATDPVTQLRWCSGYALGRYGSWRTAYIHWIDYHNW